MLHIYRRIPANIRLDKDVLKTSRSRLSSLSSENVFKTSWSRRIYSSWSYVFKRPCKNVFKASSRLLEDVLKTSARRFEEIFKSSWQDIFKTYSKRLQGMLQRYLQDLLSIINIINIINNTHTHKRKQTHLWNWRRKKEKSFLKILNWYFTNSLLWPLWSVLSLKLSKWNFFPNQEMKPNNHIKTLFILYKHPAPSQKFMWIENRLLASD